MYKLLLLLFVSLSSISFSTEDSSNQDEEEEFKHYKKVATIQVLNKITAKSKLIDIPVGSSVKVETLTIKVNICWQSSPYDLMENKISLEVTEQKNNQNFPVYTGWMFSSSPGIASIEHAVYDIVAINCSDKN